MVSRETGKNLVFRVTNIPIPMDRDELIAILIQEFSEQDDSSPDEYHVSLNPSCYDSLTKTALLEFTPQAPSSLVRKLREGKNKFYFISLANGCNRDIAIDEHFYTLTQLYCTSGPVKADIVVICGLNGHAYGSWAGQEDNRGTKRMWLRHFLSEDLPTCRTMIYGYDSRLSSASATHTLQDYTDGFLEELRKARGTFEENTRPIVLIGHSFGGLIMTRAMVTAQKDTNRFGDILKNTKATIFYATPHRGMKVHDILGMIGYDSTRNLLVESLEPKPEAELEDFKGCIHRYGAKVVSYKETEQTRELSQCVDGTWKRKGPHSNPVANQSAILGLDGEEALGIEGDHSTLVKFQHKMQPSYTSILRHLEEYTGDNGGQYMTAYSAVTKGTSRDLRRVLQNTAIDIDAPLNYKARKMTLLHIAVDTGDILKVRLLVEHGADLEAQDQYGDTALVDAIGSRCQDVVELLLRYGARTSIQAWVTSFSLHVPLLHFACKSGSLESVQALLKCGETVGLNNHESKRRYTPLHVAVYNSDERILGMLLEEGADPTAQDHISATPLHFAAEESGKAKIASLLLEYKANIDAEDIHGQTPLIYAVRAANEDIMDLLLENGAQIVPTKKDFRDTAIHIACKGPNEKLLLKLMTGNEHIHVRGNFGHYPIQTAARWASKWAVEYLLDLGSNIEAVDSTEATLLHLAAENRNGGEELVFFFLSWGANINAKDRVGDTPLHNAATAANEGAARLLIQLSDRNKIDETNLNERTALHLACAAGSVTIVEELLNKGADITATTFSLRTPLHFAAKSGSFETVKFLLEHGADKDPLTIRFSRPVDMAKKKGHMSCVRLLKGWVEE